jgi:exopolysaccharide biosynthesis polyprenyl glycosylphosphotransferase
MAEALVAQLRGISSSEQPPTEASGWLSSTDRDGVVEPSGSGSLGVRNALGAAVLGLPSARALTAIFLLLAVLTLERNSLRRAMIFLGLAIVLVLAARAVSSAFLPLAIGRTSRAAVSALLGTALAASALEWLPAGFWFVAELGCLAFAMLILLERHPRGRRIVIIGQGKGSEDLVRDIVAAQNGFRVVAAVGLPSTQADDWRSVATYESAASLPEAITTHRPDLVIVNVENGRPDVFRALLDLARTDFRISGLPEFYEHAFGRIPVDRVGPAWFMSLMHLYQRPYTAVAKRTFDVVVAAVALVITAPVWAIICLLIGRRFLYRQVRVGQWGQTFTMYKFRTMHEDAETAGMPLFAAANDPRVTRIGQFLRNTRLDELPQLWNVLVGQMSIVGPRPERPEFYSMLSEQVPWWIRRNMVKPGITGWAQIHSGYADDSASTATKLSYDLWYLRHRSLAVDLMICIRTLPKLILGFGAR